MKINIFANNIELNNALREFVEDKIGGLERFLGNIPDMPVQVEIGKPSKHHKSGPVFYAEANIKLGKSVLRASSEHYDLHSAITEVRDELKIEIKKFKDKRTSKTRRVSK